MTHLHNGHRQRLRELYRKSGADGLPDHVLLELLLSYAIPRRDVNPLAHELLERFNSLSDVLSAPQEELNSINGIGESTASFLHLIFDLHQRMLQSLSSPKKRIVLNNSDLASRYALSLFRQDRYETVRVVCLDMAMQIINVTTLSVGSLNAVTVEPRRVIETALFYKAYSILLMHNHPTGTVIPSQDDIETADKITKLARELSIQVNDQLIVGDNVTYSFAFDRVFLFSSATVCETLSLDEYLTMLARRAREQRELAQVGKLFDPE